MDSVEITPEAMLAYAKGCPYRGDPRDLAQEIAVELLARNFPPNIIRSRRLWCAANEGMRRLIDKRPMYGLEYPERVTSLYPTRDQLVERWFDEETEDQADEWKRLTAAERDSRRLASLKLLGTSEVA